MAFRFLPGRRPWRPSARRLVPAVAAAFVLLLAAPPAIAASVSTMDTAHTPPGGPPVTQNSTGDQDPSDWDTQWGPLSQYDRNLLINVRWANLWEAPTSGQVAEHSANPKVRAAASRLMNDHHELEQLVADAAAKLNVALPDKATPLQQSWQTEILSKSGSAADDAWANLTRQAHGTIFMLCATVRAQTRNDVVRAFAQSAVEIVMRHMTLLESTGLVTASSMVVGSAATAPHQVLPSGNKTVLGILLAMFVLVCTFVVIRVCARHGARTATE